MTNELESIHAVLGRKLNRAVLEALRNEPLRYSQLMHTVSRASPTTVHSKTLTRTLEHLQQEGLVEHHQDPQPAGVANTARRRTGDYRLTGAGIVIVDLVAELSRWTREHRHEAPDTETEPDDTEDDQ